MLLGAKLAAISHNRPMSQSDAMAVYDNRLDLGIPISQDELLAGVIVIDRQHNQDIICAALFWV